jgi:hypothetical protein
MLHPTLLSARPLALHRPWFDRLWVDAATALRSMLARIAAAYRHHRQRRREIEEWRAAVELDDRVLRDIGAPTWLQSQAESAREARAFERRVLGLEGRRELRHFR